MKIFFVVAMVASASAAYPWMRIYEGMWRGYSVEQTSDGGYIVTGLGGGSGIEGLDLLLFKADSSGDSLWAKTYRGLQGAAGYCVHQTDDGGYIITGEKLDIGAPGYVDLWLLKTDGLGDTVWTKTYGWNGLTDIGHWVEQTSDGGYMVTGSCQGTGEYGLYPKLWILRTDSEGDTLWTKIYDPGPGNGWTGRCIQHTVDGGYIIVTGRGMMKTDSLGDSIWTNRYAGECVRQTTDGGYILATSRYEDVWLVKMDSFGDSVWTKTYGREDEDYSYCVQKTTDGGYIVVGETYFPQSFNRDVWLLRTDYNGDTLWTRNFWETRAERGYSVQQTTDRGYIVCGHSYDLLLLIKTDSLGYVGIEEQPSPVTHPVTRRDWEVVNPIGREVVLRAPAGASNLSVVIFDAAGRKVDEITSRSGDGVLTWGEGHKPGVYFIIPQRPDTNPVKVVLIR